jgi:hypothetical protein
MRASSMPSRCPNSSATAANTSAEEELAGGAARRLAGEARRRRGGIDAAAGRRAGGGVVGGRLGSGRAGGDGRRDQRRSDQRVERRDMDTTEAVGRGRSNNESRSTQMVAPIDRHSLSLDPRSLLPPPPQTCGVSRRAPSPRRSRRAARASGHRGRRGATVDASRRGGLGPIVFVRPDRVIATII